MEVPVEYIRGVPDGLRAEAAELYDMAFGPKLGVAVRSNADRRSVIERSLDSGFAFVAICDERLVRLAGFHTSHGSLTGGLGYKQLVAQLGILKGNWAALIFSLYERQPRSGELLMDGIVVHPDMRGRGVGTHLLEEVAKFARQDGYGTVRLDVIDTNPAARRLYERNGFVATKTENFGYLRWLLGFGASTTMTRSVT
jgi:ribosomal protein S18 acetylase RimI-like enzyme